MRTHARTATVVLLAMTAVACGEALPPKELIDARAAIDHAQKSQAQQLKPAQVYEAKQALDRAEDKFKESGDSMETKDLSYVAQRKAQLAEADAELAVSSDAKLKATKEKEELVNKALSSAQGELSKTKQQLEAERKKLEEERLARLETEKRLKQAMEDLAKVAAIKEETRGMVITLSGGVLFASGKSELLPGAQVKLNEIAEALKTATARDITVEGHTDNQGSAASNLELGQKRADAVRDYLVSRGLEPGRIRAVGIGQARPVADNGNPEGRANNRRVEIVLAPLREAR